jgi:hypothetical protein
LQSLELWEIVVQGVPETPVATGG